MWQAFKSLVGAGAPARSPRIAPDPGGWRAVRRPPAAADGARSAQAHEWQRLTPPHAWPALMCERHPRVVNRLAALRGDPQRLIDGLDALLVDARGGRAGFVPMIRAEIVRLAYYQRTLLTHAQARLAVPLGSSDTGSSDVDGR